jgi:hypothetical protein
MVLGAFGVLHVQQREQQQQLQQQQRRLRALPGVCSGVVHGVQELLV